jgi:dihydrofolate reductase
MMISAIVAASDNNVIASNGKIPWNMPADVAFMRSKIKGHPLIMGSATHDSIGSIFPEPGTINVVISRNPDYKASPGAIVVKTVEEALDLPQIQQSDEAFIFGGETIYKLAMPFTQKIYLTRIHITVNGDRFFNYDSEQWLEVARESHEKDEKNSYDYDFITLERKH